jgi:hypothetical protein
LEGRLEEMLLDIQYHEMEACKYYIAYLTIEKTGSRGDTRIEK